MIPIGIAAGHVKLPQHIEPLLTVPSDILSFITLGSYTLLPRDGNEGNVYHRNAKGTSLNALGLPNPGLEVARSFLPDMIAKIHASGKKVRVSIAGFSSEDYVEMAQKLAHINIDEIELNLGCPNVRTSGTQKPIFAFDPIAVRNIVSEVFERASNVDLAIKLSPYSDPSVLRQVAFQLSKYDYMFSSIVTSNTIPNGMGYNDDGIPVITANKGFAGVAGTALHEFAVGQIAQFRDEFGSRVSNTNFVGVGGVDSGRAVRNFELSGANAVQIGTHYFDCEDPRIFQKIAEEYASLVDE